MGEKRKCYELRSVIHIAIGAAGLGVFLGYSTWYGLAVSVFSCIYGLSAYSTYEGEWR